jgi:hypothetical protein
MASEERTEECKVADHAHLPAAGAPPNAIVCARRRRSKQAEHFLMLFALDQCRRDRAKLSLDHDAEASLTINRRRSNMKLVTRSALLGAAGLVLLALPAHAQRPYDPSAGSVGFKSSKEQTAQRPYDPSAGSVGYKKSSKQQTAERPYDPSAGSVGFKKKKKTKK